MAISTLLAKQGKSGMNTAVSTARVCGILILAFGTQAHASQLWGTYSGSTGSVVLYPIDIATGAVAPVSAIGAVGVASVDDMASDPLRRPGVIWGVRTPLAGNQLVAVDPFNLQLLSTVALNAPSPIRSVAIDPTTGLMYGATLTSLYTINSSTGATQLVGPTGVSLDRALGFDVLGNLYGIEGNNILRSVNKATGATATVATLGLTRMEDMAFDPDTGIMYGLGFGYSLYQINVSNGDLTVIGPSLGRPAGMAFTDVPEPTGLILGLCGLVAACGLATRP
jgi:hypothetical protein